MYYKNGEIFDSVIAIRNSLKDVSLPVNVSDLQLLDLGFIVIVDIKPIITATQYLIEGNVILDPNGVPTKQYTIVDKTQVEIDYEIAQANKQVVQHFTDVTTQYIQDKIDIYNNANNVAFKDIDAFSKYGMLTTSPYHAIAIQFMTYADNVWTAVRAYQATATAIPTEAEFKTILDSVVF